MYKNKHDYNLRYETRIVGGYYRKCLIKAAFRREKHFSSLEQVRTQVMADRIYDKASQLFFLKLPKEYEKMKYDKSFQDHFESNKFNLFDHKNKYYNYKKKRHFNIYKKDLPDLFDT